MRERLIAAFRLARPASIGHNVRKTILQVIIFWTTFLAVLPLGIVSIEDQIGVERYDFIGQSAIAIGLFALASALGLVSAYHMSVHGRGTPLPLDAPRRLVIRGPYRVVRNPMAIAGLAQGAAVGIGLGSWLVPIYVLCGGVLWNWFARPHEEAHLLREFGAPYARYQDRLRCWIPSFRALPPSIEELQSADHSNGDSSDPRP